MIKNGLKWSIFFLLIITSISVYGFYNIPSDTLIPTHFNIEGKADQFSERNSVLISMPLLSLFIIGIFIIIPIIDPRRKNLEQSRSLLYAAWFGALSVITLVHGMIIFSAAHNIPPKVSWVIYGVAILLIITGNFMAKSRSSWFLGLRTPWTLSSEHSWLVANRLTGWLMLLTGVVTIMICFTRSEEAGLLTLIIGTLIAALAGIVISYFAWRNDPDRNHTARNDPNHNRL